MAKKPGDITHIFASQVPNLDWLDVNENDYRAVERLPRQNLDIVPDLVEAWSHDSTPNNLIPNIDKESSILGSDLNEQDLINVVSKAVKERMMSGWDAKHLASWVRDNVDQRHIAVIIPTLKRIASERNLLGKVYIDATHWENCDRGEGQKIANRSPLAKYVLGQEEKCSGCIHNQSDRCGIFQKKLVFDVVPYDQSLVDEYSQKLKVPGTSIISSTAREKVREIFAYTSDEKHDINSSDLRPIETEGSQDQRERRASGLYEPPSSDFQNPKDLNLYRDLSQKMMASKGGFSDVVKTRFAFADSEALTTLRREENLLGKVYVRPDQFHNCHTANNFFRKHHITAQYILEIPNKCQGCSFYRRGNCSLIGKEVVTEIPYTQDVLANEIDHLVSTGKLSEKTASQLLKRSSSEPIHDILAEAHGHKEAAPEIIYSERYDVKPLMTDRDAVSSVVKDPSTAIPLKHRSLVQAAYRAAYRGVTGPDLKEHLVSLYGTNAIVNAGQYLKPIVRMAGLLGNVILDMRGFKSAQEAGEYIRQYHVHPQFLLKEGCGNGGPGEIPDYFKNFPYLTKVSFEDIWSKDIDVEPIVENLELNERISSETAINILSRVGSANPWTLLQEAYLAPKPIKTHEVYRPTQKASVVSKEQVNREFKNREASTKQILIDGLYALVDTQLGTDSITPKVASEVKKRIASGFTDKDTILLALAKEGERYALEKKVKANKGFVTEMAKKIDLPKKGHIDIVPEKVLTEAPKVAFKQEDLMPSLNTVASDEQKEVDRLYVSALESLETHRWEDIVPDVPRVANTTKEIKVSSTQRTAFQTRLLQAANKGLQGDKLKNWIRNSYDQDIIQDQVPYIRKLIADNGIGQIFIDPTPYRSCNQGAKEVVSNAVKYVRKMSKCNDCVYRSASERCQIYNRTVMTSQNLKSVVADRLDDSSFYMEDTTQEDINPIIEYGLGHADLDLKYNMVSKSNLDIGFEDDALGAFEV